MCKIILGFLAGAASVYGYYECKKNRHVARKYIYNDNRREHRRRRIERRDYGGGRTRD